MEAAKNWVQGWGQGQNSNQGYRLNQDQVWSQVQEKFWFKSTQDIQGPDLLQVF